jgi:plastocyanin
MKWLIFLLLTSFATGSPFFNIDSVFSQPEIFFGSPFDSLVLVETEATVSNKITLPEKVIVEVGAHGFSPEEVEVSLNQEITWINGREKIPYLLLGLREISSMKSQITGPGDSFTYSFSLPGEYTYVDAIVIGWVGKIIVHK